MAGPYEPIIKNVEYIFYISVADLSVSGGLKANPTLADGDITVSTDGGAFENVNAYSVTPASGRAVKITLSATQMNGDNVYVVWADQTNPKEWADGSRLIQTASATRGYTGTALPAAAADAAGGLPISDAGGLDIDTLIGRLDAAITTRSTLTQTQVTGGAYDVTNANVTVRANLVSILGTALTETAGQIAAAFKKFFNVATPVLTMESVNQTGDALKPTVAGRTLNVNSNGEVQIDPTIPASDLYFTDESDLSQKISTAINNYGALKPTTAGRTLDVTETGAAGIDWGNVEGQDTANYFGNSIIFANINSIAAGAISFSDESTLDSKLSGMEIKLGTPSDLGTGATLAQNAVDINTKIPADPATETSIAAITGGTISVNVKKVNDVNLTGDGSATPWGPA